MKSKKLFCSAVIVAAGRGTRMNMDINKQYVNIGDKPVLAHTLSVFEECPVINEIILVVNSQDIVFCKQNIVDVFNFNKIKSIAAGGNERQNSVYNGLCEVSKECDIVLIHDGARPFVDDNIILSCQEAAAQCGASCAAVPVKDTIKRSNAEGFIGETLERSLLWSIQTPQGFKYKILKDAHEAAVEEGFTGTDDAVLVERTGMAVKLIMGSYFNIKITTQEDLIFAGAIARATSSDTILRLK